MAGPTHALAHRTIDTNGIRMHLAEQGTGPLVLLCHGFPESWYSWRHQLPALAAAGFRAVAPDMRGYGQTDRPAAIDQYTVFHLVGDMVGVLDALGEAQAVVVGHDWGAPVAWHCALLRPDRFRAVVGMSVPFGGRGPGRSTLALRKASGEFFNYILYFQKPGAAEAELERDPRESLRRMLVGVAGDAPLKQMPPKDSAFLPSLPDRSSLPAWLTDGDLDFYGAEFRRTGFAGGLNWYRNLDRNWELSAALAGAKITVPALFVAGTNDVVVATRPQQMQAMPKLIPNLRKIALVPGVGHWTQQEGPAEVNGELISFLEGL